MLRITKNRTKTNIMFARFACLVISFTVLIGITLYNNFAFADEVSSGNGNSQAGGNAQNVPHHQNLTQPAVVLGAIIVSTQSKLAKVPPLPKKSPMLMALLPSLLIPQVPLTNPRSLPAVIMLVGSIYQEPKKLLVPVAAQFNILATNTEPLL